MNKPTFSSTGAIPVQSANVLPVNAPWTITNGDITFPFAVPGDVHSALIAAGHLDDPYWRDNELKSDWVHEVEWTAATTFDVSEPKGRATLRFASLDCIATVAVNGVVVGSTDNQFCRWDFDVTDAIRPGRNELVVTFASNTKQANVLADAADWKTPHLDRICRLKNFNLLRKTQCHGGWDWNIALAPLGIYGPVWLEQNTDLTLQDVIVRQHHTEGAVTVEVDVSYNAHMMTKVPVSLTVGAHTVEDVVTVYPGSGQSSLRVEVTDPRLWWPAGQGDQPLYPVAIRVGDSEKRLDLGLRTSELDVSRDEVGARFALRINDRDIFCKGANWIPGDALPARATPEAVEDLLDSAVAANMNMIRIWGGGQYEADWFYEMCDRKGIMIWHDFMFSCHLYPGHDNDWLAGVEIEARQQIARLSHYASVVLWCGDNEVVGALGWYPESIKDRDRYLAIYDRLNATLERSIKALKPGIPFWPSSPSVGRLNFDDGWHVDTSGDMHFWDVWHSAKPFEHYRTVKPRFCSEFGFQSFPSMRLIETFTNERDRNVSSDVMGVHQRDPGGNARIVETIQRYFRFPDSFDEMTWLSQVSQAEALKTAIEFWRTCKPRTMGTLFWQLNDTWPVASWASVEYGGAWKLLQYRAKGFYEPIMLCGQPEGDDIVVYAVNDRPDEVTIDVSLTLSTTAGQERGGPSWTGQVPTEKVIEICRVPAQDLAQEEFLTIWWKVQGTQEQISNTYLPKPYKSYDLKPPQITAERNGDDLILTTDTPAFYVTLDWGQDHVWSDNGFTLLPGHPKKLSILRKRGSDARGSPPDIRYMKT